jgi:hypothetical protein
MLDLEIDRDTKALTGGTVTGLEALAQRVWLRLSRLQGEWFLSLATGLPPEVVGGRVDAAWVRERVRAQLLDVAGVLEVPTLTAVVDSSRRLTITCTVRSVDGTTGVTL